MDSCSHPSALVPVAGYPYFQHPELDVNLDEQENKKGKQAKVYMATHRAKKKISKVEGKQETLEVKAPE